ncbi:unnamed protein product, partial [Prorocentrum cordatum]
RRLLTVGDDWDWFVRSAGNAYPRLKRKLTSEGSFFCGSGSEPAMLVGRSNVLDTFPGGQYRAEFEHTVAEFCAGLDVSVRGPVPRCGDAEVLQRPSPVQLARVYFQMTTTSRLEHIKLCDLIIEGLEGVHLAFAGGEICALVLDRMVLQ